MGDLNRHVGRNIDGLHEVHGGYSIGERHQERRVPLELYDEKHLCIAITWLRKADKKITYGSGCNKSEIDLCIIGKVDHKV